MTDGRQISNASARLNEPRLLAEAKEFARVVDPAAVSARVSADYSFVGCVLDNEEDAMLLVDPLCHDDPIVGASRGFTASTGYQRGDVIGRNCRMMMQGVPEVAVSKSVRKNLRNFSSMSCLQGVSDISEVASIQPNARQDSSHFCNFFLVGRVTVCGSPYLLGVLLPLGEGLFAKIPSPQLVEVTEKARAAFRRMRERLRSLEGPASASSVPVATTAKEGFTFYAERLQDHCILFNGGRSVMRREPQELSTNCMVFSSTPVHQTPAGLFFAFLVDDAVPTFEGLPIVGFTRRRPADAPTLYPAVSRCQGASVLVGGCGEAFARDKMEHFKIGFKPPPQEEVTTWALQPNLPPHKRRTPVKPQAGDVIGCMYTREGRVQLWFNGAAVLDFDVGKPVDESAEYYAVIDVCLAVYGLTLLNLKSPEDTGQPVTQVGLERALTCCSGEVSLHDEASENLDFFRTASCGMIDEVVNAAINNAVVKKAICAVVASCRFCVTVADPRGRDIPLIAVSDAFETVTGYSRSEILGVNCRFLNEGCPVSPSDLASLRMAAKCGAPYTALLPNRKKSGEMFINLLDVRGLTIARNMDTGEDLWYLVGIQADVTGMALQRIPCDHFRELQECARLVRGMLRKELSLLATDGADAFERDLTESSTGSSFEANTKWQLVDPVWRSGPQTEEIPVQPTVPINPEVLQGLKTSPNPTGTSQGAFESFADFGTQKRPEPEPPPFGAQRAYAAGALVASGAALLFGIIVGRTTRRE